MIPYATISRLHDYEACPLMAKLKYADKIPEPVQADSPAERGTKLHQEVEDYINKKVDTLSFEALGAEPYATQFRNADPPVITEQLWTFDEYWQLLPKGCTNQPYFKAKLDVFHLPEPTTAFVCDWKFGKKTGNEIKHADQMRAYVFAVLCYDEQIEDVNVVLRYASVEEETAITTYRSDVMRHFDAFNTRIKRMLDDIDFYPKPSLNHCRYCPYKKGTLGKKKNAAVGTGHCDLNPE